MAKKPPKESPKVVSTPIQWLGSPAPSIFANQMVVQADENDFYLSFFEIVPPLLLGDEADQRKQLEEIGGVQARCVARIVISSQKIETFAEAIMQTAMKHRARREAERNTDTKEK